MATILGHLVLLRVKKKTENTCIQIHMNSRFYSHVLLKETLK